ncbi:hypothetical protein NA57DRAFT_58738 [Rhizodiscina lignyota]|uniref:Zn(2)-C6 fungal-type domain-containing protein n=1 Tax=Rhizodiscina lignyota TaxID=1504668 RepID=A0A9P4M706_9PEZI|nr:hypothetical protein NA57DRAFT_58738 [Rhizodiscina lignyota]
MANSSERNACRPCATAKRRCGKQTPQCQRCRRRGIECTYPPSKASSWIPCGTFIAQGNSSFTYSTLQSSLSSPLSQVTDGASLGLDLSGPFNGLWNDSLASTWFTSPETWKVTHSPQGEQRTFSIIHLKRQMAKLHSCIIQWAEEGSNAFVHPRLYQTRFPRCAQDAYTALLCYIHRTSSNERTIMQIMEDRIKQLLADHDTSIGNVSKDSAILDTLEHIARVQALLVYQVIGLYDGDIRLRHLAEASMPVLNNWMVQMVEHASQAVCLGSCIISLGSDEQRALGFGLPDFAHCENLPWYSWVVAESIRRTWIVASGSQAIFQMMKQACVPCMGGMMLTTRKGVWEAPSALAWVKLCSEVNVGLMQMTEVDKLFTEVTPEDVDDFAKIILDLQFGKERLERWGVQIED